MTGRIREILFDEGVDVDGIALEAASKAYVDAKFDPKIECYEEGIWLDNTSGLPTLSPWRAGVIAWDTDNKCMAVSSAYSGTWLQVGEETQDDGVNKTGSTLTNGTVVYIDGAQGNRPKLWRANAGDIANAQKTIGLITADAGIGINQEGPYTTSGVVRNLNTSMYADGDLLWLSTTDGQYTKTKPANQYRHIMIGIVVKAHNTQGEIYVNIKDLTDQFAFAGYYITDPHGWTEYDNTYMTRSWNTGTRTFTLTQVGTSTPYYAKGELKFLTGNKSITLDNTPGAHFICLNTSTEVLEDLGSSFPAAQAVTTHIITEYAYVDETGTVILYSNERHTTRFLKADWIYKHRHLYTQYLSGLTPSASSIDGNGSLIAHAQFAVTTGIIEDEDISHTITAKLGTNNVEIAYYNGTNWKVVSGNNGTGVLNTGTGRAAYNNMATGLVECTNNYHVLCHVFATNTDKFLVIIGQAEYQTQTLARLAAKTEITTIITTGLPISEYRAVATFLYKTNNTYSNAVKSALVSVDTGIPFYDWRVDNPNPISGSAISNHNNLTGLQGGQAGEYYHLTSSKYSEVTAGTVVTTTGTQTLTNKYIDGGTASANNKLKLPNANYADLVTWSASSGEEGMLVYANDTDTVYVRDGSTIKPIGSGGAGKKNYISNPSAESNTSGWSTNNLTVVRSTSGSIPRETTTKTAFQLTSALGGGDYYFMSGAFLIDDVDWDKRLCLEMAHYVLNDNNWQIDLYESDAFAGTYTRVPLQSDISSVTVIKDNWNTFRTYFKTNSAKPYLKLKISSIDPNRIGYFSDIAITPDFEHGLIPEATDKTRTLPLRDYKHYLFDGTGMTSDVTLTLPSNAAGAVVELTVYNIPTGYKVIVDANGSEKIFYDDTDNDNVWFVQTETEQWAKFTSNGTKWIVNDGSSVISGTFAGSLEITGSLVACISPSSKAGSDAAVTLTSSDNRFQYVTLTAARVYKLPSTNIKAGETFTFINRATNDSYRLNLQASADTGTTYVDWIVNGKITVMALQDAPTAAAHWVAINAFSEWISYTPILSGMTLNGSSLFYKRSNGNVDIQGYIDLSAVGGTTAKVSLPSGLNVNTSLISASLKNECGYIFRSAGTLAAGLFNAAVIISTSDPSNLLFSYSHDTDASGNVTGPAVVGADPFSSTTQFTIRASVPITEWSMFN